MKRLEVTTAAKLQVGDRFYMANDKAKLVCVKVEHQKKQTSFQTYSHFYCYGSVMDHQRLTTAEKERNFKAMKADTIVVFLRQSKN